jgi:tetratricopeptide (TPR) repeat protein
VIGEPRIGDVLDDRYRIVGRLGTGGMGSVYRAEHVGIRRSVAIKLLHPTHADDPDFARRFEREAIVTGRTSHPNCVTVSDFGRLDDGGCYLVMELVDGILLADLLDELGHLPERRALHIVRHVLRGLDHAHRAGIVHRDVKPTNVILVEQDGDPDFAKLLDFGIAKLVGDAAAVDGGDNQLTRVGSTVGTPTYVAPEQAVGATTDARADLYSVSIMLYELLTGVPPFRHEDTVKLLAMHLSTPVPPMLAVAPGAAVSRDVEEVVRKGLAKDRADRWASAAEYGAAIDALLAQVADVGATSTPFPAARPATAPPPARRLRRALIAGAGVVLAAGILVAATRSRAPSGPPGLAPERASEPSDSAAESLAARADVLLARGRASEAVSLLQKRPETAASAAAQLQLGHALVATDRGEAALAAYRLALELDRDSRADPTLRANLEVLSRAKIPEVALPALELRAARLDDGAARATLVEIATKDKRNPWRGRARAIAADGDWLDRDGWLASYLLDLAHGRTCDERKKAVAPLRELDDERAVPWLRKARSRTSGGLLGFGAQRVNGCMRKELDEAIAALES